MLFRSEEELEKAGEELGKSLSESKKPQVLALVGELGAGKTAFTRGVARGLGVEETPTSPTFVLAKQYAVPENRTLWHIDAYRLMSGEDMETFDFKNLVTSPDIIAVVEWADRIKDAIPDHAHWLYFAHHGEGRTIEGLDNT